jgi:hypothetical protein
MLELNAVVRFVDATRVYPEVLKPILSSSFSAKSDFDIASRVLPSTGYQLVIRYLFAVSPSMRTAR